MSAPVVHRSFRRSVRPAELVVLVSCDGLAAYQLEDKSVDNGKVTHHIDFSDFAGGMRRIEAQR